jgi:hypothetical protein
MQAGVGKKMIPALIKRMHESLTGETIDRLPAASTVAEWAAELGAATHAQVFERATAQPTEPLAYSHDATSKSGSKVATAR